MTARWAARTFLLIAIAASLAARGETSSALGPSLGQSRENQTTTALGPSSGQSRENQTASALGPSSGQSRENQTSLESPPYEDKLIEAGKLAPLVDAEEVRYNPDGLPRSWRVEGFASRIEQGGTRSNESGVVLSGRLDTVSYGAFSFDGTFRKDPGGSNLITVWQRGLPFDRGWIANNGFGMLNTPGIDLSRNQFRFFLPTFPIVGAQTEWLRAGNLQIQASAGEPGLFNGLRVAGFSRIGGSVATAGAQWMVDPLWTAGFQVADARNVAAGLEANESDRTSGKSLYAAAARRDGDQRLQFNFVASETDSGPHRIAAWLDGEARDGRFRHNYGAFKFEPDLSWGYVPFNRDVQGGYYRLNYQSQQWIWSAGVDSIASVHEGGSNGLFGTGSIRYQVDSTNGVGGGATLRHSGTDAVAGYAFLDHIGSLGTTRVQVDAVGAQGGDRSDQVTVDHAWPTKAGLKLSTSLTVGRDRTAGQRVTRSGLSAFGGIDLGNNITLDGNIRVAIDRGDTRTVGRYANLGLVWRLSARWALLATYYDNRSEIQDFPSAATLLPSIVVPPVPRDRAIFLTLRYEDHAGTPSAPLGGLPGSGAGTIVGYLYYDANDDGRRSAGEAGAANVTIVLDGKFATRTDRDGRFEFPLVASGRHTIAVVPDNLALPYTVANEGRRELTVTTRETTSLEIAARRQ